MGIILNQSKRQNVFVTYLNLLGVKYTPDFSNKYFNEHPHKYNLWGISKMLSEFKIENAALKIKDKEEVLKELEAPFIAHIATDFVVVSKLTAQKIQYIWKGKEINISLKEFLEMWTGIMLLAEPDKNSKEPNYEKHLIKERIDILKKLILFIASFLLVAVIYISQPEVYTNIGYNLLLLCNITGLFICYLLIKSQMKIQSSYADKICSLFKQGDCNSILESDAAKLFGIISWSEIGLGYFISNIAVLLFFPHFISFLTLINICALPYTLWSIWYQKFKVKQWCTLCMITQALLWAIFLINLLSGYISLPLPDIKNIVLILCVYAVPILITNLLVTRLTESGNVEQIKQEINSIKAIDEVFIALLEKQPRYSVSKGTSRILFGNPESNLLVTVFTNPHCNPCANMHKRIEKLLAEGCNNLCIQYIFCSFDKSLDSSSQFLLSTYLNNRDRWLETANAWFENGKNDKEKFFKLHNSAITEDVLNEFEKHEAWKNETGINATPTILVNGYKLPDNYKIEDLRYLTDLNAHTK